MADCMLRAHILASGTANNTVFWSDNFKVAALFRENPMSAFAHACKASDAFFIINHRKPVNFFSGNSKPFSWFFFCLHFLHPPFIQHEFLRILPAGCPRALKTSQTLKSFIEYILFLPSLLDFKIPKLTSFSNCMEVLD